MPFLWAANEQRMLMRNFHFKRGRMGERWICQEKGIMQKGHLKYYEKLYNIIRT